MLAWLLSAQQVVLLCNNHCTYLFYRDQVYFRPTKLGFVDLLHVHREHPSRSVWGLIDVDRQDHPPPIPSSGTVWPIQASSEKPIRWKAWHKQVNGALWGMPLWSLEELVEGYVLSSFYLLPRGSSLTPQNLCSLSLSPDYNTLRSILEEHLPHLGGLTAPKTGNSRVDAILEVLHLEREREMAAVVAAATVEQEQEQEEQEEATAEEYPGELRDDTSAPATDQDQVYQTEQQQVPVYKIEQALTTLVRIATEEFGFIPRDVYEGILNLPEMRRQHAKPSGSLDYSRLKDLIHALVRNRELDVASRPMVVVFPTENRTTSDQWEIDFKSMRVAEHAAEMMRQTTGQHMWKAYDSIRRLQCGSILAGRIFEEIAHRVFCERSTLLCRPMISEGTEPPTFVTSIGPLSLRLSPFPGGRLRTRVDFKTKLSNVTLDSNEYYVPAASDNPLFDSFIIDAHSRPVVISVFQVAIASKYEGSAEGYFHIRRLRVHVRRLLKDAGYVCPPYIKVRYFLVCPDDGSERRWEMPAGWSEGSKGSHRGDVFCIRVRPPV